MAWSSNTLNNVRINYFYIRSFASVIFEEIGETRKDCSDLQIQMRSGFFTAYFILVLSNRLRYFKFIAHCINLHGFRITLMAIARISVVAHKC